MTTKELKLALEKFPDDTIVMAYDPNSRSIERIIGLLFGYDKKLEKLTLEIQTDE